MSTPQEPSSAEDEIRDLIDEWRRALCAKDLKGMLAQYAPEVLFYDVTPPYKHEGVEAYERAWKACFPYLPERMGSELQDLKIIVRGDLAFAHLMHRLTHLDTGAPATCNWVRATVCYERREGQWVVVHEHVSVPFDPMTSKAAFISTL